MKTYNIEMQKLKSVKHDKGLIEVGLEVLVLPQAAKDTDQLLFALGRRRAHLDDAAQAADHRAGQAQPTQPPLRPLLSWRAG
jgi:hypothetical protein